MGIRGILGLALGYGLFLRPRLLRWGATREEVTGPFPGADLIPGSQRVSTMAVTLNAPPSRVWPWLVQMGYDRAGWYSWDRLDRGGEPSARELHPEWQQIARGDRLLSEPKGPHWFEVAAVEPERFLGLRAAMDLKGRQFDSSGPRPRHFTDSLWAFQLTELPGHRTRLVVSAYSVSRPKLFGWLTGLLFWEPAHWIMQTRQFRNLKARVEQPLWVQKGELHAVSSAE
jgi:proline iminopeptidase